MSTELEQKSKMSFLDFLCHPGFKILARFATLWLCLIILCIIAVYTMIVNRNLDGVAIIVTGLLFVIKEITGFDWGSSASSQAKDAVISNMAKNATES